MAARTWVALIGVLAVACAPDPAPTSGFVGVPSAAPVVGRSEPVRLVFVGDLMLGRSVAPVAAADPGSVFERLRPVIVAADLAFGNLESPLTDRPHRTGDHALEADPAAARLLAGAGFDALQVANNHASDAGPDTVLDTLDALGEVGLAGVGGGTDLATAGAPLVFDVAGTGVGVLAFDLSGGTPASASTPGVNRWNEQRAAASIAELRDRADVVVVGLHGGVEYLSRPDPVLVGVVDQLAEWGVDVVWGHGAHVDHPVDVGPGERPAVVASGLGNALFDQRLPGTQDGTVLEVLADRDGVLAFRTGTLSIEAGRSVFDGWDDPDADAVAFDGEWWSPVRSIALVDELDASAPPYPLPPAQHEVARSLGDVTGTGADDLVVAYRRAITEHPAHDAFPDHPWADDLGRSAHIAVYTASGRMRWGSAVLIDPIGDIAVCDGAMAVAHTTLDDDAVTGGGAWFWDGFGFRTAPVLPGSAHVGCADIDRDGRPDPVLVDRDQEEP